MAAITGLIEVFVLLHTWIEAPFTASWEAFIINEDAYIALAPLGIIENATVAALACATSSREKAD